jgi:regulator of protease activity HflC (stomatin/prohibitin superfamily)
MQKIVERCLLLLVIGVALAGCTRVETGHVGVRVDFSGNVEPEERTAGWHQTLVGHLIVYVANEMTVNLSDLHPQTKDRSTLDDLDMGFTYSVSPTAIADLVVKYKGRDLRTGNDLYPLGQYVINVVTTATSDVFSRYDALEANVNREKIRDQIRSQVAGILKEEGLENIVKVHQIFIKNLQIARGLQESALRVISAQNDLRAKEFEVQTARKEAERLSLLSKNHSNISYMNAKANADIAEGIKAGKVHTVVIPYDFRGLLQVNTAAGK